MADRDSVYIQIDPVPGRLGQGHYGQSHFESGSINTRYGQSLQDEYYRVSRGHHGHTKYEVQGGGQRLPQDQEERSYNHYPRGSHMTELQERYGSYSAYRTGYNPRYACSPSHTIQDQSIPSRRGNHTEAAYWSPHWETASTHNREYDQSHPQVVRRADVHHESPYYLDEVEQGDPVYWGQKYGHNPERIPATGNLKSDNGIPPRNQKQCPSYDGKSSFNDFLLQYEMVGEYNQWDRKTMASQLAMCLKDDAVAVLSDLSFDQRRQYDSLVAALRDRFEPENQTQLHRAQLKARIRQPNETLPQLAHDIRKLVRDANPLVPANIREAMAKDSFLDALNDRDLELAVFQGQPKTLQDALKVAMEMEAFHKSHGKGVTLRSCKQKECSTDTETGTLADLRAELDRLREELRVTKLAITSPASSKPRAKLKAT